MAVATAAEYATVRTFFLEYDKPRILAVTDIDDRVSQFHFLVNALWGWTSKGHYDLLPVFAELRILTPRNTFPYLARGPAGANLLPMIESLCPLIDGGLPGLIDYGMECHASDVRCAIKLAYDLWPESFADIIAKHYERPGFISTLVSVKGVQDKVDHKVLAMRVIQQFGAKGGNEGVTEEEAGAAAVHNVRTNGLGKLMLRVLCDPGDCGASAWAAIDSLAPVQRFRMFSLFAREMPNLDYSDASQEPAPTLAVGLAPVGWPTWQYVLDRMLPPTMDARTGSGPVRDLIVRGTRAWLSARRSSSTADSNKKVDDPWSADLRTASAVAALPIDPGRHSEQLPLWVAARVCILAPDVVLPIVSFTAHTPTWLWQMRLDVIKNVTPAPEGWQPARLKNWVGIVATAMANERPEMAKLVMEIAFEEQRVHGEPSANYAYQIRGMSKKWPVVVDLAHEAGYMDV
ncbi:hypothetical protein BC828DRAFT_383106 [Blastocladiella britannica]|nr:hypothetical protein BC828DRAFT_383106 [Blastocladiella britannica]